MRVSNTTPLPWVPRVGCVSRAWSVCEAKPLVTDLWNSEACLLSPGGQAGTQPKTGWGMTSLEAAGPVC